MSHTFDCAVRKVRQVIGRVVVAAVLGAACVLAGCADPVSTDAGAASFPAPGAVDYQLGGAYDPPPGVTVVERDSADAPAPGIYSICYVNGFQTQPGDRSQFESSPLVLRGPDGQPVMDPNWPDEYIFDITTASNRAAIIDSVGTSIDRCEDSGFAAVEVDNLDTYTRFSDAISRADAVDMARLYVDRAHDDGLQVGQKNSPDDAQIFAELGFDFAVAEECAYYDECSSYTDVYGPRVIDVEYSDALRGTFDDVCRAPNRVPMTVLRDRRLLTPNDDGFVYDRC